MLQLGHLVTMLRQPEQRILSAYHDTRWDHGASRFANARRGKKDGRRTDCGFEVWRSCCRWCRDCGVLQLWRASGYRLGKATFQVITMK